jgi:hypothetical protein
MTEQHAANAAREALDSGEGARTHGATSSGADVAADEARGTGSRQSAKRLGRAAALPELIAVQGDDVAPACDPNDPDSCSAQ